MLFNSIPFLFCFLPVTFAVFFLLGRRSRPLAGLWLAAASLFYYGWWNPYFVGLLLSSVIFNYSGGYLISREIRKPADSYGGVLLTCAVAVNLLLLAYFKYAGFFSQVANQLFGVSPGIGHILLPLGISFFTFTQIAFLADTHQGKAREYNFVHYLLFVTYFPHLIAGPILHHSQMMPQFAERSTYKPDWTNISAGLTVFVIGLSKKMLLADTLATIATPIFSAVQHGGNPPFLEAWLGALGYTLQLYFDFSGYSDMAIGLSLLFNIKLPLNFNSPYKATDIIDFWRRWHMSLSTFLRDYLYIPLGGNRKGRIRRYINLFVTMVLGGLWHGAGWTYVAWGALHGLFLIINHGFRALYAKLGFHEGQFGRAGALAAGATTFLSVVIAWVFFRADSFATAITMLHGMFGGFGLRTAEGFTPLTNASVKYSFALIGLCLGVCWLLPNSQEIVLLSKKQITPDTRRDGRDGVITASKWHPILRRALHLLHWEPSAKWGIAVGFLFFVCLTRITHVSEFIYYQF